MSVNTVDCKDGRITLHGDYVLNHQENVDFKLEGDRIPAFLRGEKKADLFLTSSKVIVSNKSGTGYNTFVMSFQHIRGVEVKQPILGANYLKGHVIAEPNGGWEGNADFKIVFNAGGAIEFAEAMQKAVRQSRTGATQQPPGGFYPPPPLGGYYYPPYNTAYAIPPQGYGGQPPYGTQPMQGAPGQAPPPYPGPGMPPPQQAGGTYATDAKAREAYASGPNVYIPSYDAPPPYNPSHEKKSQ